MSSQTDLYAPLPSHHVGLRLSTFELEFKNLFGHHPKRNFDLSTLLENLISDLRSLKQIMFALADNNLGPLAGPLEQFVKNGLDHPSDST